MIYSKLVCLFAYFCILPAFLFGQSLKGRVTDETGSPIPYASLQKSVKIQKGDTNEILDSSRVSDQPSWLFKSGTGIFPGYPCPPRGKRHDYFTSALPWTQKGPCVSIGLAGTATLVDPSPVSGYFVQQSNNSLGAAQLSEDGGVHSVFTGSGSLQYQGGYSTSIAGHSA